MAITDAQFAFWLKRDNRARERVVLAELDYKYESAGAPVTGTKYLADRVYIDESVPRVYVDAIKSAPQYSRSLSGERLGVFNASLGTLELANADGLLDTLLDLACDGSDIRFYLGDATWAKSDFRLIYTATVAKIEARTYATLTVTLKDASILIDKSIGGDNKIGGNGPNADRYKPLRFGYCHQVEAVLTDAPTLTYAINDSNTGVYTTDPAGTWAITIRDKGYPAAFTYNGDGTITLTASPAGSVITADTLVTPGTTAGYRGISDAMDFFVGTKCGLTAASKYYGAHASFNKHPQALTEDGTITAYILAGGEDYMLGVDLPEHRNAQDLLAEICDTGLCFWAIRRDAQFTYGRLRPNYIAGLGLTSSHTITPDDDRDKTFKVERLAPLYSRYQGTMSRNFVRITEVAGALSQAEVNYLTRDGLYRLGPSGATTTFADSPELYDQTLVLSPTVDTLLSGGYDTADVTWFDLYLENRRAMLSPWIDVISVTVGMEYYDVELGDVITVQVPRFGYTAGVDAQVIGVNLRLTDNKVDLKLIRRRTQAATRVITTQPTGFLLQENGDYILQETADKILL